MRKMICTVGLPLLLLLASTPLLSQSLVVKGRVTDPSGSGIPGVSVMVKGETQGTSTGTDGSYVLSVPSGATTLIFSAIGFGTQEVTINSKTLVNTTLQSTSNNLNEVVVIGYGTRQKRDLTGSVTSVTSKDFNKGS
ncbi:MAG TPA: carboxypeptidase-like regulatory domain-containing protein, partial [Flavisolibacter sp.]|nr:carboxypeptidase-like regulatory domain-containing protein [Flavisolibacter sp.]